MCVFRTVYFLVLDSTGTFLGGRRKLSGKTLQADGAGSCSIVCRRIRRHRDNSQGHCPEPNGPEETGKQRLDPMSPPPDRCCPQDGPVGRYMEGERDRGHGRQSQAPRYWPRREVG